MAQLAHMVYFTLHDPSPENTRRLVAACHQYLSDHEGVIHFSVGTLNRELSRPVNDLGFHVCLNVVFDSKDSHDKYQTEPRHLRFIEEQKAGWKQVRVFDSDLTEA